MIDEKPIRTRYQAVRRSLDERGRRLHAAAEALTAGHGGVAATSRATKVARSTIGRGIKDLSLTLANLGGARESQFCRVKEYGGEFCHCLGLAVTVKKLTRPIFFASNDR